MGLFERQVLTSDKFVDNCLVNYNDSVTNKIRCKKCKDNFLMISGKCLTVTVDASTLEKVGECEIFDYYTRRCAKCKDLYFLNGGICYKGFIANCLQYTSINKCKVCEEGYVALQLNESKAICFAISSEFNCQIWNEEASRVGELECLQCK